jgi:hypothetical protein
MNFWGNPDNPNPESRLRNTLIYVSGVMVLFSFLSWGFFWNVFQMKKTAIGWIDNVEQYYLWSQFCASEIHQGRFPLIVPTVMAGMFFPGELQHAPFYPVSLLWYLIFGTQEGIRAFYLDMQVVFHAMLGGMAMTFLARSLHISRLSSLLAGAFFAFGGAFLDRAQGQANIFFGLAYAPLALGALIQFMNAYQWKWAVINGIALGMGLLAGHFVSTGFALLSMGVYLIVCVKQWAKPGIWGRWLAGAALSIATCAAVSFIQFFPSLEYQKHSLRWVGLPDPVRFGEKLPYEWIGEQYRLTVHELVQIADPAWAQSMEANSVYIGLIPVIIILIYGYFQHFFVKNDPSFTLFSKFSFLLMVLGLMLAFGRMTPLHYLVTRLPLGDAIRQSSRYVFLFQMGGLLLFGLSLDALVRHESVLNNTVITSRNNIIIFLCLALATAVWLRFGPFPVHPIRFHFLNLMILLLLGAGIYTLFPGKNQMRIIISILCLINIFMYRNTYLRDNTVNLDWPCANAVKAVAGDSRIAVDDSVPPDVIPRNIGFLGKLDAIIYYGATLPADLYSFLSEDWSGKSYDRLAVKYLVSTRQIEHLPLVHVDEREKLYMYSRPDALPEVYALNADISFNKKETGPRDRMYEIRMDRDGEVIFTHHYHPGWRAEVDGKLTSIHKTGGYNVTPALMGIHLASGTHTVRFHFPFWGIFSRQPR